MLSSFTVITAHGGVAGQGGEWLARAVAGQGGVAGQGEGVAGQGGWLAEGGGSPGGRGVASQQLATELATWWAVCLLHSRRRTFLLVIKFGGPDGLFVG